MKSLYFTRSSIPVLITIAALAGCSDDPTTPPVTETPTEQFPAPEIAGTPETDSLADAPARCGQADHTWKRDIGLGEVKSFETKGFYPKAILEAAAAENLGKLPVPLKYDVRVHVITYVTQDRGVPVEATAMVAWPVNVTEEEAPLPALTVLHGTSGFTDGCGPSGETDQAILGAALASIGYIVVAPDYIGLKSGGSPTGFLHPYLVGQATAIASLDAVRALGHLPEEIREGDARPSARVAVVGGSQGGHAALWVDRLAPYYARELDIVGVAATVPPADLVEESRLALTMFRESTLNVVAFFGASAGWYGKADALSTALLPPLDVDVPTAMAQSCDPTDAFAGKTTLDSAFQPELLSAASSGSFDKLEPWGCMANENGLTTTSVPRIQKDPASYGILFITGESDTLVDTPTERASFKSLCDGGMPMQYLECAGASHTKATTWALPEILTFLGDRVAGKPFEKQCTVGAPVTCSATPPL